MSRIAAHTPPLLLSGSRRARGGLWDTPLQTLAVAALLIATMTVPNLDLYSAAEDQSFNVNDQLYVRLAMCAACGFFAILRFRDVVAAYQRFPAAWLVLLFAWAIFTAPRAIDVKYASGAIFANLCVFAFVPTAARELGLRRCVQLTAAAALAFVALAWILYFVAPDIGRGEFIVNESETKFRLGNDPQNLGLQALWGVILLLTLQRWGLSWLWTLLGVAFCLVSLIATDSRTAIGCAAIVVAWWGWNRWNVRPFLVAGAGVALLFLALALGLFTVDQDSLLGGLSRSGRQDEIYNLTGRTFIWDYAFDRIAEAPIIGHGYGCARHVCYDFFDSGYAKGELHHVHNLHLNTVLCLGVVGGVLLALTLLGQLAQAFLSPRWFPDAVLFVVLAAGVTEPVLLGPMPRSHTVMWAFALLWRYLEATGSKQSDLAARSSEAGS